MITLTPILDDSARIPLYQQLFLYIKEAILCGDIPPGEKLPSLRALSKALNLSITTIDLAYSQLQVEGYIESRPQSGYYVNAIKSLAKGSQSTTTQGGGSSGLNRTAIKGGTSSARYWATTIGDVSTVRPGKNDGKTDEPDPYATPSVPTGAVPAFSDPACFDFTKWKKCMNHILTERSHLLLAEGDSRGEAPLRYEISKYIYQSRGVSCHGDQVIIGAGTQQLISLLCIILQRMGIDHVSFENPGYQPVRGIFRDRGFKMTEAPIDKDGIQIEKLPTNIRSSVYVSPSNQFPTGSVMPAARRYALLDWAFRNNSIVIEDDYNSELRYDSRPVPSLQGLDTKDLVVYLGSFSSTLFPSIKISYMVLPANLNRLSLEVLDGYTQTCSKTEQLTLALYMENGSYLTHLKRLRKLYAQKKQAAAAAIQKYAGDRIRIVSSGSGLHMLLELTKITGGKSPDDICHLASKAGLILIPIFGSKTGESPVEPGHFMVIYYYTRIPMEQMENAAKELADLLS